jgi:hypothetical protein
MFAKAFAIIRAVIHFLPILQQIIMTIETALPPGTSGVDKLEMARKLIESAYEKEQQVELPFNELWPALSNVISHLAPIFKRNVTTVPDPVPATAPVSLPNM